MTFDTRTLSGIGVLVAIADCGNFARAGERLGLSPSGVSRAVARLEARVGVRLFDRSPRSVQLSEEGRRFHDAILPLLDSLEDAASELADSATVARGRLRVSIDPWFARVVVAPALPGFLSAHPALSLDLTTSNYREEMMAGVDVAVRFGPPHLSSLIAVKLADIPVVTVAAPSYLETHGEPKTPQELVRHQTILFRDPQSGRPFAWEYQQDGRRFDVDVCGRIILDDPSMAIEACVAGHGIFQSLDLGLGPWRKKDALVPILAAWAGEHWPIYAYRASRVATPAKITAFLDFLRKIATVD